MLDQAKNYLIKLSKKEYGPFILIGPTERGKTFLIKEMKRFIAENSEYFHFAHKKTAYIYYSTLGEMVSKCLEKYSELQKIKNSGIVFIEEFLSINTSTTNAYNAIVVEKAFEILNLRSGRPTVMDTNKSVEDLKAIDIRILSRLYRDNGMVIEIPTKLKPYLSRGSNTTP